MNFKAIIFLIAIILLFHTASASFSDSNLSKNALAAQSELGLLQKEIQKLRFFGIKSVRINDLYQLAFVSFKEQVALDKNGGNGNYSIVSLKVAEANRVIKLVYDTNQQLTYLQQKISETQNQYNGIDLTITIDGFNKALQEFKDERFELSQKILAETIPTITTAISKHLKEKTILNETQKSVLTFFEKNWVYFFASWLSATIIFFLARKSFKKKALEHRINRLITQQKAIEDLVKLAQKQYFEDGSMPETIYKSRLKLFVTKLRDLTRQIALLREELTLIDEIKKMDKNNPLNAIAKAFKKQKT